MNYIYAYEIIEIIKFDGDFESLNHNNQHSREIIIYDQTVNYNNLPLDFESNIPILTNHSMIRLRNYIPENIKIDMNLLNKAIIQSFNCLNTKDAPTLEYFNNHKTLPSNDYYLDVKFIISSIHLSKGYNNELSKSVIELGSSVTKRHLDTTSKILSNFYGDPNELVLIKIPMKWVSTNITLYNRCWHNKRGILDAINLVYISIYEFDFTNMTYEQRMLLEGFRTIPKIKKLIENNKLMYEVKFSRKFNFKVEDKEVTIHLDSSEHEVFPDGFSTTLFYYHEGLGGKNNQVCLVYWIIGDSSVEDIIHDELYIFLSLNKKLVEIISDDEKKKSPPLPENSGDSLLKKKSMSKLWIFIMFGLVLLVTIAVLFIGIKFFISKRQKRRTLLKYRKR